MKQLIVLFNLKNDVRPETFEDWARKVAQPNFMGLDRVSGFRTFRSEGMMHGFGSAPAQYVEVFDITDLDAFMNVDMTSDEVKMLMGAFTGLVEAPQFMIASEL